MGKTKVKVKMSAAGVRKLEREWKDGFERGDAGFEMDCPLCGARVHVDSEAFACPECGGTVNVSIKL